MACRANRPLPELLARAFPGLRYIQITREDKIRQAVSLWKAVQTQAWKLEAGAQAPPVAEPVFSFRAINYLVRLLTAHDASWDAYFLGLGHEPLRITYEELAGGTEAVVARVLDRLGVPVPDTLGAEPPRLAVQAASRFSKRATRARRPPPLHHGRRRPSSWLTARAQPS